MSEEICTFKPSTTFTFDKFSPSHWAGSRSSVCDNIEAPTSSVLSRTAEESPLTLIWEFSSVIAAAGREDSELITPSSRIPCHPIDLSKCAYILSSVRSGNMAGCLSFLSLRLFPCILVNLDSSCQSILALLVFQRATDLQPPPPPLII